MKKNHFFIFGICTLFLFTFNAHAMAGTKPEVVKSKMEECADALEELKDDVSDFLRYVNGVKENIDQPVDEQDELSAKEWKKMITGPRAKTWREEKDKVKNSISVYQKKCQKITKAISNMDKPAE